jgi:EmrB/QacA subfamily drug resistance transporter
MGNRPGIQVPRRSGAGRSNAAALDIQYAKADGIHESVYARPMSSAYTHCDALIAAHPPSPAAAPHGNWVLATTILASSLAFIDGSVVNVGLPAVGATFNAGAGDLQWVINAYLLPLSALLLLGGAAGDRYGHAHVLVGGIALFGAASIGCALAPSLAWLLVGRGLQGVGAALLMPNSLAILGAHFSGAARGRAIGIWASAGATMGAIGPVLGGWLIDTVGWRAIFLINLPLATAAIVLAIAFVRDARREDQAPALDLLGGVLATASLGAVTWGLTLGSGHAGWTPTAVILVVAGVVLMLVFLGVERSKGEVAMMPLALFRSSSFIGITALTLLLYGALGALFVLIPYVLIRVDGYSAVQAGAALLPAVVVLALASPVMGAIAGRLGSRAPLTFGPLVVAAGFLLIFRIGPHTAYWVTVFPAILVIAMGMAGAVAPLTTAVFAAVDSRHTGSASGLNSAVARTGGMVATALLGGVLSAAGPALVSGFHTAAVACAVASIAASASAFFLITAGGPPLA